MSTKRFATTSSRSRTEHSADLVEELGRDRTAAAEEAAGDRAVDVQITRLRRKIEPDPREPRYLQTVRGLGYMLAPD